MPELPEVETVRQQLSRSLPIEIVAVKRSKNLKSILKEKEFSLGKCTIEKIERKGKWLDFVLSSGGHLLSHFGMSGGWLKSRTPCLEKHLHLEIIGKSRGKKIFFSYVDPRRFGKMYWLKRASFQARWDSMGVDISGESFSIDYIRECLKKFPNKQLKVFLLDQKYFAGVGNYIANEICARAGIRPTRRCGKVTLKEIEKIYYSTQVVLDNSLKMNGVTFHGGYKDTAGKKGNGVQNLVVFYQDTCQLCQNTPVKKIFLAQRGTYYCPRCQH